MTKQSTAVALADQPAARGRNVIEMLAGVDLATLDTDKLEKLLAMQERILDREAEQAFNAAMMAVQRECPAILRDAENSHTKTRYARLETINRRLVPIYTAHGFSLSFGTADSPLPEHVRLTCKAAHVGGYSRDYQIDVPLDGAGAQGKANKTATQATGSTVSYGRRYLTCLIFNVALTNEDDDGNGEPKGPAAITAEQRADLDALLDEFGPARARALQYALTVTKRASLDEITAGQYDALIAALRKRHREANA